MLMSCYISVANGKLEKKIGVLEKEIFTSVENKEITNAENYYIKAKALLKHVIDDSIQNKWKDIEQTVSKSRADHDEMIQNSKNIVEEMQETIKNNEENNELESLIENCNTIIIHTKILKETTLMEKYSQLLEESLEKKAQLHRCLFSPCRMTT